MADMRTLKLELLVLFAAVIAVNAFAQDGDGPIEQAQSLIRRTEGKVFRDAVTPHWLREGKSFWYRVSTAPDKHEFVHVDAVSGAVRRAGSLKELGLPEEEAVSTSAQRSLKPLRTRVNGEATTLRVRNSTADSVELYWVNQSGERRSYGRVRAGDTKELSTYAGHVWLLTDSLGSPLGFFETPPTGLEIEADGKPSQSDPDIKRESEEKSEEPKQPGRSPDGKWSIRFENHNAMLVTNEGTAKEGTSTPLTTDGTELHPYRGPIFWNDNSKHCVVLRVKNVPRREVTIVTSSPRDQLQPKLIKYDYFKPGDELPQGQPVLVSVADKSAKVISNELFPNPFTESGHIDIRWSPRCDEFTFDYNQRGHQIYRILAVNAASGAVRKVIEESSPTFIEWNDKTWRRWLDDTNELLWMSERDGWAHLWLYDAATGSVKNQVTRGEWVVRRVLKVNEKDRCVWFLAGGVRSGDDPYYHHLCRVNFDGSGFIRLTEGDGDHAIEFSPHEDFFIDRWSRVDHPTVTELRLCADGRLVCQLERADIALLLESGWKLPERFVAKGRDGKTGIHGILIKPTHFDPQKKYPVVEEVYAGPHGSFTPKSFSRLMRQHVLAELGFIIVQADGMGTDERGKQFHDVCWKRLEDAGFPDRIAWIKAAAESRPWMDLTRVGIYGGSAGGQSAMRALIDHHDFYKVAVADCGCHDNRMDKIWWNEQWLGWPLNESYLRSSNVEHAGRMHGNLLLIVGELDTNVDPASTMQVVNALQKAGKSFDFMPLINTGHGAAETPYGTRLRMEYLTRHLLMPTSRSSQVRSN